MFSDFFSYIRQIFILPFFCVLLIACGSSDITGTYADQTSNATMTFDDGIAVHVSAFGTNKAQYVVDGNKIILQGRHGDIKMTLGDDGVLTSEYGVKFVKVKN